MSKIFEDQDTGIIYKRYYRGSYEHFKEKDDVYAEESFEVYRSDKNSSYRYISEITSRALTGELLKTHVDMITNKDAVPSHTVITKSFGKDSSIETYKLDSKTNTIDYTFETKDEEDTHLKIPTSPKFHLSTPATVTSILFYMSKKFDTTSKNFYNIIHSKNQWVFEEKPLVKVLSLERQGLKLESINIRGKELEGHFYKLSDHSQKIFKEDDIKKENPIFPSIKVFISRHLAIPYLLEDEFGHRAEIVYLNDFSESYS